MYVKQPYELTYFLNTWLGRNVTTRRGVIPISSPVRGFRPLRAPLLRTTKFPNPAILTESPFCNTDLRRFKTNSTRSAASFFEIPTCLKISSAISAFLMLSPQRDRTDSPRCRVHGAYCDEFCLSYVRLRSLSRINLENSYENTLILSKKFVFNTIRQRLPCRFNDVFRHSDRAPFILVISGFNQDPHLRFRPFIGCEDAHLVVE